MNCMVWQEQEEEQRQHKAPVNLIIKRSAYIHNVYANLIEMRIIVMKVIPH